MCVCVCACDCKMIVKKSREAGNEATSSQRESHARPVCVPSNQRNHTSPIKVAQGITHSLSCLCSHKLDVRHALSDLVVLSMSAMPASPVSCMEDRPTISSKVGARVSPGAGRSPLELPLPLGCVPPDDIISEKRMKNIEVYKLSLLRYTNEYAFTTLYAEWLHSPTFSLKLWKFI